MANAAAGTITLKAALARGRPASWSLAVRNPVLLLLCAIAITASLTAGFMSHAPNRLADGVAFAVWDAPRVPAAALGLALVGLVGLSLAPPSTRREGLVLVLGATLAASALLSAGLLAMALTEPGHPAQRQALGPAFWILIVAACLIMLDAMQALGWTLLTRALVAVGLLCGMVAMAATGLFSDLSLTREFLSHRTLFLRELARHAELVAATVLIAVAVCIPLIWVVRSRAEARAWVYSALGLLQTIPSIALFGLLIAPLGFLAAHLPLLKAAGVSGLGVTPALIALVLYSAFPLVRMSDAALSSVPGEVVDAARGLGFSRQRRFLDVDLPLALPVLLSGLRVVTLQAIGLATVAALIGGGGLGTFVFEGIGQYALDLVLVGAIPVILFALAVDFGFRLALAAARVPS